MLKNVITGVSTRPNWGIIAGLLLYFVPVLSFGQQATIPPGQKVFVTNDKTAPVPVSVTNPVGINPTIPYRKIINTVPAAVLNDARANYYWCIEYIAGYFETGGIVDYVKVEIYKAGSIPVTLRLPVTVTSEGHNFTLSFPTKLRIADGETLRIEAITRPQSSIPAGTIVRSDLILSGFYEPIPK